MYCPKCLEDGLFLKSRGVVELVINGKQMDAGRFLFNKDTTKQEQIYTDFKKKLEEFFAWYSKFKNADPIQIIELSTADFKCEICGHIPSFKHRFPIVNVLIPQEFVEKCLKKLGEKYKLDIQLKPSS
jgi:hypothetical protein